MALYLTVEGKTLLFVMAAKQEYGKNLKQLFKPLMLGVGPVEAAVNLTRYLGRQDHAENLPDLIVSLGSAGSNVLEQAEIYQASSVSYRDMDASPLGFEKGQTPLIDLPIEIPLPIRISSIPTARLSTGANIVSGNAYSGIDADMVDMETFAIKRGCQQFNRPLIALRGISDGKEELKKFSDWTQYLEIIDTKLSLAVEKLLGDIANRRIET